MPCRVPLSRRLIPRKKSRSSGPTSSRTRPTCSQAERSGHPSRLGAPRARCRRPREAGRPAPARSASSGASQTTTTAGARPACRPVRAASLPYDVPRLIRLSIRARAGWSVATSWGAPPSPPGWRDDSFACSPHVATPDLGQRCAPSSAAADDNDDGAAASRALNVAGFDKADAPPSTQITDRQSPSPFGLRPSPSFLPPTPSPARTRKPPPAPITVPRPSQAGAVVLEKRKTLGKPPPPLPPMPVLPLPIGERGAAVGGEEGRKPGVVHGASAPARARCRVCITDDGSTVVPGGDAPLSGPCPAPTAIQIVPDSIAYPFTHGFCAFPVATPQASSTPDRLLCVSPLRRCRPASQEGARRRARQLLARPVLCVFCTPRRPSMPSLTSSSPPPSPSQSGASTQTAAGSLMLTRRALPSAKTVRLPLAQHISLRAQLPDALRFPKRRPEQDGPGRLVPLCLPHRAFHTRLCPPSPRVSPPAAAGPRPAEDRRRPRALPVRARVLCVFRPALGPLPARVFEDEELTLREGGQTSRP